MVERCDLEGLAPEDWAALLVKSTEARVVNARLYPAFPEVAVQQQFVGSANAEALGEAFNFYKFVRARMRGGAEERGCAAARYVDFGCGWGRISRFFLRDFERGDIVGLDIDPDMIDFCRSADLPGLYLAIRNNERLPFSDSSFKLVTAYSVFTHLPEALFRFWMMELGRILAPGGMIAFTVEPARFIDFIDSIGERPESDWHAGLARHKPDLPRHRESLKSKGIAFMPTGGGGVRTTDIYGDAVVTSEFLSEVVAPFGTLETYLDDASRFWQAVAIVRKKDNAPARLSVREFASSFIRQLARPS